MCAKRAAGLNRVCDQRKRAKVVAGFATLGIAGKIKASKYPILMDKFVIRGGNPLLGTMRVSGAKNAALPAMAAAILTDETIILENIPDVRDIQTERKLLVSLGAEV